MTTTTQEPLSKKQRRVLDALNSGKKPKQIAKSMGITTTGIYAHMRRIEAKGYEVPRADSSRHRPASRATPASANGSGELADIREGVEKLISKAGDRQKEIDAEITSLTDERNALDARIETLSAESAALGQQREALEAAQQR